MKPAQPPLTHTYLDNEHSTSLRNLLAFALFAGIAQVIIIQLIPFYLYAGLVVLSMYLLFGKNKVAKKLKNMDSQQLSRDRLLVENKIKSKIRYLNSSDLLRIREKGRSSGNVQSDLKENLKKNNSFRPNCSILDFPLNKKINYKPKS